MKLQKLNEFFLYFLATYLLTYLLTNYNQNKQI